MKKKALVIEMKGPVQLVKVRITQDREKLWKCKILRGWAKGTAAYLLKSRPLPDNAGAQLAVELPGRRRIEGAETCDSKMFFYVPDSEKPKNQKGTPVWVCMHQIDVSEAVLKRVRAYGVAGE